MSRMEGVLRHVRERRAQEEDFGLGMWLHGTYLRFHVHQNGLSCVSVHGLFLTKARPFL